MKTVLIFVGLKLAEVTGVILLFLTVSWIGWVADRSTPAAATLPPQFLDCGWWFGFAFILGFGAILTLCLVIILIGGFIIKFLPWVIRSNWNLANKLANKTGEQR